MKKILFVGNLGKGSTFIDNDYKALQKYFEVRAYNPNSSMTETFKNVLWCDIIFSWFASYRAIKPIIFSKLLKKKVVVVAGGYDCVDAPEINYGAFARTPDRWVSKFVFKHADIVLPVSKYLQNELLEKLTPKKTYLVYNGVSIKNFYPKGNKVDDLVITVGEINQSNLKRKGLTNFVKTAKYLPKVQFVVIGEFKDEAVKYLKSIATDNVMFLGRINDKDLLWWYQKAKVYAQLSYHEGFGISVAEAMLCRCIPIVSNKGALPEVAGFASTFYNAPKFTALAIEDALKRYNDTIADTYRLRIKFNFSLSKRIEKLRRILE